MRVTTYEATIENGQIKISEDVRLPEHARIYVLVPGFDVPDGFHVGSPRLADPDRAVDFLKEVAGESPDAGLR